MTSRERVLAAIAGRRPDRIPCDYHAAGSVSDRLRARLGLGSYTGLLEYLGVDVVDIRGVIDPVWVAGRPMRVECAPGVWQNYLGFRTTLVSTPYGDIEEHCGYILEDAHTAEDCAAFTFPKADWFDFSDLARRLDQVSGFAVMASGASVYQHPTLVRGIDNLLCDFLTQPDLADYLMDGYTNYYLDYFDRMFTACPGRIDILRIADDLGMQDKPLLGVELAEQFVFPRVARLCQMAHSHGVKVMMHSCGSIDSFIPGFIGAGVDILDPVQPLAKNMDLGALKARFGGQLCFHGSIDTQHTLPLGTPGQVRDEVFARMALFDGEGGFIIAPAHTLQPDVPTDNILAMYRAVREFNKRYE